MTATGTVMSSRKDSLNRSNKKGLSTCDEGISIVVTLSGQLESNTAMLHNWRVLIDVSDLFTLISIILMSVPRQET